MQSRGLFLSIIRGALLWPFRRWAAPFTTVCVQVGWILLQFITMLAVVRNPKLLLLQYGKKTPNYHPTWNWEVNSWLPLGHFPWNCWFLDLLLDFRVFWNSKWWSCSMVSDVLTSSLLFLSFPLCLARAGISVKWAQKKGPLSSFSLLWF